jgi:NitT/TauT family transport system permease protein
MNLRSAMRVKFRREFLIYPLFGLVVLGVWYLIGALKVFDESLVPPPFAIFAAMRAARPDLQNDIPYTLALISVGFVVTIILSFLVAVCLHFVPKRISGALFDLLVMLQSIPLFAIAPVLFYFTGRDRNFLNQLITVVLAAFFPVLVTTAEGLRHIDKDLADVFESMNATRWQKLVKLEIPSALYMVVAGSKITLTMCVIGAVLAEMLVGEQKGLGFRIRQANALMNMAEVFACLILLAVLTTILFGILKYLAELAQPWASSEEE